MKKSARAYSITPWEGGREVEGGREGEGEGEKEGGREGEGEREGEGGNITRIAPSLSGFIRGIEQF